MPEIELIEKLKVIEQLCGSAGRAARTAGVTPTSWSRWKNPDKNKGIIPSGPRLKLIELLYEQAVKAHHQ